MASRPVENVAVASSSQPVVATDESGDGASANKVINPGDGMAVGRDYIVQNTVVQQFCPIGGELIVGNRFFGCPQCNRSPLCEQHFNVIRRLSEVCIEEQSTLCAFCGDSVSSNEMFTCFKCHKVGGNDHLSSHPNMCTECSDRWGNVVQAMDQLEVAVDSIGNVVTTDEVELGPDGVLRTIKDHRSVATIKNTTWYARTRQWHQVRPNLVRRERQAMLRFYPDLQLGSTSSGDFCRKGLVSTWTGNSYEILLQYPARFPYVPPKAYILNPKIVQSRHIYKDGHLCLFHTDDKAWQMETTAATMMSWVSLWLHCYEVWIGKGVWPRKEADDFVITPNY